MAPTILAARRALCLLALAPCATHAGLSIDEALARHRDLSNPGTRHEATLSLFLPDEATPDGLVVAAGGPGETVPPLLRPTLPGLGGVQWTRRGGSADGLQWRIGLGWRDSAAHSFSLDGSELSAPLGAGRAYASVGRRHWGPSWVGSLILDSAAPAIPSIGWRKTESTRFASPWLSWLGPWNADLFFGALSGHVQPRHPKLIGMRAQFMPLPDLELGISRAMEWGGSGRPQTVNALWQAFIGRGDNPVDEAGQKNEPSNQLAGFDARYTLRTDAGPTYSIYAQAIGEDKSHSLPVKYLGSVGIDTAFAWRGVTTRWFAESANTVAGGFGGGTSPGIAYQHHIYLQGYTEQGKSLGYPAGGDVKLVSVGALFDTGPIAAVLMFHSGTAKARSQFFAPGGSLSGANAALAWRIDNTWRVGAQIDRWHDLRGDQRRAQLWLQYAMR